ncbi:hypothetical protein CDV55_100323 [Aspergillus turcosus]|uniref:Uncharacterized protein n=1 Tax=Aspergillus turcosus TaxID=1245748 RepID=A0A229WJR5_9EURO|nr:hypothetical protein CDV55_100323 [Aspergillus turcosus]RLL92885.1 hypothetical protein CFD26_100346 [Aspergillus turcosus]
MTRRDISKEALKARRSAIINHLQQLRQVLSSVKTSNFEIDELRELGLKLVRVELAPDKELFQFEPCFFLPQPTSVFLEHPLIEDESLPDLEDESLPDLQRGDRIPEEYSGLRDYGRKGLEYLSHYAIWSMMAYRCGIHAPHRPGNLRDLTPLRFCEYECRLPLHDLKGEAEPEDEIGRGIWYPIHAHLDKSAGTPHAILELIVQCRANDTSLTQGEVSGLLGAMYRWYTLREFRQHAMCPVSLHLFFTDPGLF